MHQLTVSVVGTAGYQQLSFGRVKVTWRFFPAGSTFCKRNHLVGLFCNLISYSDACDLSAAASSSCGPLLVLQDSLMDEDTTTPNLVFHVFLLIIPSSLKFTTMVEFQEYSLKVSKNLSFYMNNFSQPVPFKLRLIPHLFKPVVRLHNLYIQWPIQYECKWKVVFMKTKLNTLERLNKGK